MRQKTRDMTSGKPAGIIVSFALPLMLGNVFQQLYTVMDSVIVCLLYTSFRNFFEVLREFPSEFQRRRLGPASV